MIHGRDAAAGYIIKDGVVTGETHQCSHCQYVWEAKPGSGNRRGFCSSCNAMTCGRESCRKDQEMKLEKFGLTRRTCLSFDEYNFRLEELVSQQRGTFGVDFVVSEYGLVIPRKE